MGIHVRQQTAPRAVPRRLRPPWLRFLLWSLVWMLRGAVMLLVAILTGFLVPQSNPNKYRPFAPKTPGPR